jgi:hypothetical protein
MYRKFRKARRSRKSTPRPLIKTLKAGFTTKTGRIHMLEGAVVFGLLSATSYGMGAFSYLNNLGLQVKAKMGA